MVQDSIVSKSVARFAERFKTASVSGVEAVLQGAVVFLRDKAVGTSVADTATALRMSVSETVKKSQGYEYVAIARDTARRIGLMGTATVNFLLAMSDNDAVTAMQAEKNITCSTLTELKAWATADVVRKTPAPKSDVDRALTILPKLDGKDMVKLFDAMLRLVTADVAESFSDLATARALELDELTKAQAEAAENAASALGEVMTEAAA